MPSWPGSTGFWRRTCHSSTKWPRIIRRRRSSAGRRCGFCPSPPPAALHRAEAVEKRLLVGGEAVGPARLELGEHTLGFLAVDGVQLLQPNLLPALRRAWGGGRGAR